MGTDIYGWVEVQHNGYTEWRGVIQLSSLVRRNYRLFSALFGVRADGEFTPAFAGRGLPQTDMSDEAVRDASDDSGGAPDALDATWILWSEFENLDWSARGQEIKTRPWLPASEWQHVREDPAYEIIEEQPNLIRRRRNDEPEGEIETLTLLPSRNHHGEEETYIARKARWRLDEFITPDWQTLFDMVALLAKRFGSSSVRFVVWFI